MPVICVIGINYTQEPKRDGTALVHYSGNEPDVTENTSTRRHPRFVIAAYNRNQPAWAAKPTVNPLSPLGFYGASNATARSGLTAELGEEVGNFHFIMTNVSPFITQKPWQEQVRQTPRACSKLIEDQSRRQLDDPYDRLGSSIDLWIAHSAIGGTQWVWPTFADFVRRHNIKEWLLSGNLNPQAHLWHNAAFRKPFHVLYDWYE